jgi:hypothetical protein
MHGTLEPKCASRPRFEIEAAGRAANSIRVGDIVGLRSLGCGRFVVNDFRGEAVEAVMV